MERISLQTTKFMMDHQDTANGVLTLADALRSKRRKVDPAA